MPLVYGAIAFAVGIGLFLLIWAKQRAEDDFYRADTSRQSATGQVFEPLPQPDSGDAGLDNAPPAADDAAPSARIVETQPPPPPPGPRSEERRVGQEFVRTCSAMGVPYH